MMATRATKLVLGESDRVLQPGRRVGFDNLPDQVIRNRMAGGFVFNVLVCGETAVGKSTLMNSLLKRDLNTTPRTHTDPSVGVATEQYTLEESGVTLKLTIATSTGLGDQLDKEQSPQAVLDYIDEQFDQHIEEELKTTRDHLRADTRVHACLYLLPPTGRVVKQTDLVLLKALHNKVNLIPVIAKADTITPAELEAFRESVQQVLADNGIGTYDPWALESVHARAHFSHDAEMIPLATVASNEFVTVGSESIRVRQYPWGVIEVENPAHSNLGVLRDLLLRTHTHDLIARTSDVMYEHYRQMKLIKMGFMDHDEHGNPVRLLDTYHAKKTEYLVDLDRREAEIRQRFVSQVASKEQELDKAKEDLELKYTRLRAIHMKEEQRIQKQMEDLDAEREGWQKEVDEEMAGKKGSKSSRRNK